MQNFTEWIDQIVEYLNSLPIFLTLNLIDAIAYKNNANF